MQTIPGVGLLGFGFDILGSYDVSSATKAILVPPSGNGSTFTDPFSKKEYSVPNNVTITEGSGDHTQSAQVVATRTRQEFQGTFDAKAGVSGSYRGFSGEFNASFSAESGSENTYWYCMASGRFETWSALLQEVSAPNISKDFADDPDVLAMSKQTNFNNLNRHLFFRVFRKWGTHFIDQVTLGGEFNYLTAADTSYSSDRMQIEANLGLEFESLFVDAAAQSSLKWQQLTRKWVENRRTSWAASGGDTSLLQALNPSPGYEDSFTSAYRSWVASIPAVPAIIGFRLSDLSRLFSGSVGQAISDALNDYLNQGLYLQAEFSRTGFNEPTSYSGLIQVRGHTIPSNLPPQTGGYKEGGAQIAVFDPDTLQLVVDAAAYSGLPDQNDLMWGHLYTSVQGLSDKAYIVALTVYAVHATSGFPTGQMAAWLASYGAAMTNWKKQATVIDGDDDNVNYLFVGQHGTQPGQAIEKFTANSAAGGHSRGYTLTNVSVPLIPPSGGNRQYTIATAATSAGGDGSSRTDAEPAPQAAGMCYWNTGRQQWWNNGDLTCFDGTARICRNGDWVEEGSC
ncbi:MAC/perforin domain-containing protein [Burkholderia pyrrocinia]|uniref:MAC/perforin domain-containing protein n=1 Tax=Burkholderia pyrrocinia TaxID=60550 RepID=UPI001BD02EB5|nr:MAC/perforin domain-containing protein [Burkholderia pyrrocinia]QVN21704.1 hypothetical protein JYG32_20165 [Burkholderia pyrrocinia]